MTEFINDRERRMTELEDMRLAGKFGKKDEYTVYEIEAMIEELQVAGLNEDDSDLDAIEALFTLSLSSSSAAPCHVNPSTPRGRIATLRGRKQSSVAQHLIDLTGLLLGAGTGQRVEVNTALSAVGRESPAGIAGPRQRACGGA